MVRNCPNCKSNLALFDYSFCSICGAELPVELRIKDSAFNKVIDFKPDKSKGIEFISNLKPVFARVAHILNLKLISVILLLFVSIGFPLYVIVQKFHLGQGLTIKSNALINNSPVSNVSSKNTLKLSMNLASHVFGADKITEYIPYEADVYIEAHDFSKLSALFAEYDPYYEELVELLKQDFNSHFAIFGKEVEGEFFWGVILIPFDEPEVADVNLEQYTWLKLDKIDNAYIISNSDVLIENAKSAKSKISKNLQMNSKYILSKNSLPKSGQVFIFALTPRGKEQLNQLGSLSNLPDYLGNILTSYNKSGLNDVIIY